MAGEATSFVANFAGLSNGAFQVTWQFDESTSMAMAACAQAGVASVGFQLTDASDNPVTNGLPSPTACPAAMTSFTGFPAGVYLLSAQGMSSSNTVVFSVTGVRVYAPAGGNAMFTETLMPASG